jgi:hypothetical protein
LLLFLPKDNLGSFAPGQGNADAEIVVDLPLPDGGTTNSAVGFASIPNQGVMSISQLNTGNGGEAKGSFSILIGAPDGLAHVFNGHFKSKFCAATADALFP